MTTEAERKQITSTDLSILCTLVTSSAGSLEQVPVEHVDSYRRLAAACLVTADFSDEKSVEDVVVTADGKVVVEVMLDVGMRQAVEVSAHMVDQRIVNPTLDDTEEPSESVYYIEPMCTPDCYSDDAGCRACPDVAGGVTSNLMTEPYLSDYYLGALFILAV